MDTPGSTVGYKKPPAATRFKKGQSGNPRGRPRNSRREVPYDTVLGQMVTIREDGRERRVTAAEAFLLHLTKRGLEGDSAAARASLTAIEAARAVRRGDEPSVTRIVLRLVSPGSVGTAVEALGMVVKLARYSEHPRYQLKLWIVEAALERLGDRHLTTDEQEIVVQATQSPAKVSWPDWWSLSP